MNKLKVKVTTKETELDGEKVRIIKLTMKRLKAIQAQIKLLDTTDEEYQMKTIYVTLRNSVVEAADMEDEDFDEFNPKDLVQLVSEVMSYSGVANDEQEEKELGNSQVKTD